MDSKSRTSLPSRFRDALATTDDTRMILTTALEPCLAVYPYSAWCEFEKKIAERSSFDPSIVLLKRLYIAGAVECPVDGHGRILIPPTLKDYAGIAREVIWCGMVGHVELWDRERWQATFAAAQAEAVTLGKALASLGL